MVLAFVPSSLLLSVTTYLTTDIAAIPLFWVVPLAFYLLSFVLVFARRPLLPHALLGGVMPLVVLMLTLALLAEATQPIAVLIVLHLLGLLVVALVCHGELARRRPRGTAPDGVLSLDVGGRGAGRPVHRAGGAAPFSRYRRVSAGPGPGLFPAAAARGEDGRAASPAVTQRLAGPVAAHCRHRRPGARHRGARLARRSRHGWADVRRSGRGLLHLSRQPRALCAGHRRALPGRTLRPERLRQGGAAPGAASSASIA